MVQRKENLLNTFSVACNEMKCACFESVLFSFKLKCYYCNLEISKAITLSLLFKKTIICSRF